MDKEISEPLNDLLVDEDLQNDKLPTKPKRSGNKKGPEKSKSSKPTVEVEKTEEVLQNKNTDAEEEKLILPEEEKLILPEECLESRTKTKSLPENYQSSHGGPMSAEWFGRLKMSRSVQKAMCYSESLLMVTEAGESVGKLYCTVSEAEWNGLKCLSVHSGSSAEFQSGLQCGTTVTGFVNSRLRILHEYIHEWAKIGDKMFERKTFLIQEKETMHCRVLVIKDKQVTEDRAFFLSKLECQNLITESGSILFQRIIIQEKKTGEIIVRTVTAKGVVVRCTYHYIGHGTELVKGENIKVFGIRRTVMEEGGSKMWDSLFNYFGRLVLRCQPENDNALVPMWFEAVNTPEILESSFGSRPPLLWACDLELYAKYITQRREKAGEYRTYLKDHPELRALLSDFLQAALQQKPANIVGFAANYFEPWLPYQTSASNLDVQNQEVLSAETHRDNGSGEDMSGESGSFSQKGFYPIDPLLDEDNVFLEENNEYYLKELQDQGIYGDDGDAKEMTTVYKNYAAFQSNEQLQL